ACLAEIIDGHGVGAAQRIDVDFLDAVEIHDDIPDVTGELNALAVGRDIEALVDVGAVEQEGVHAVLTLDLVAAVAGIPLERVVAGAENGDVVALVAIDETVAVAAEQMVGTVATENGVVAGAAIARRADKGGKIAGGAEGIVPAIHVDDEILGG